MAVTTVKPLFIDANGVYRPVSSDTTNGNKIAVAELQIASLTTSNGVLKNDGSGNLSSGLIANANVDASAAIAGSKIDASSMTSIPAGNLTGSIAAINGSALTDLNAGNLNSGTIPDARFPATLPASSGANLTSLSASNISSGSLADARLSANVALYDASTPAFTNKLGVGSVTDSDTTKAARVDYVISKVNAAIAGLDYKQEAQVYFEIPSGSGVTTIAGIESLMNATTGVFTTATRALVNFETADIESGIYTITGSDGAWTLTRASDMAATSDAAGAYIFCTTEFDGSALVGLNTAFVCQNAKGSAVVGTNTLTFAVYGVGTTLAFNAPLSQSSGTVSLTINSDTLEVASSALKVSGLPLGFKINNSAVSTSFTKSNADTLVNGATGDASALHTHQRIIREYVNGGTALTAGKAVSASAGNAVTASKTDGKVWGVVVSDPGAGTAFIATSGAVVITTPTGSPSVMDNLYLDSSGDLCTYASLSSGDHATKVGKYLGTIGPASAPMIAIAIQEFGIKP